MSDLLNELVTAVKTAGDQEVLKILQTILKTDSSTVLSSSDVVKNLLKINKAQIIKLTTELIAEWSKEEANRLILTDEDIINVLLKLLKDEDEAIIFNSVRALGNICYENESACVIVEKTGIDPFLHILKNDDRRKDESLTLKTTGLLINLFNMRESLIKAALRSEILPVIEKLLSKYSQNFGQNEILLTFLSTILNTLCDYLDELNIPFKESLCQIVISLFKKSDNPAISVPCLEIFHGQSEKDEIKALLAKEGICELLFDLIEKHQHQVNDEDSRAILKMACDLIVIILTGDDCMFLLYNNGEGKVYSNMISWLDTNDLDLVSTGVLAIGNFARKDVHCIQMVKSGISKKLIVLLSKYNTSTEIADITIQHALLSTLKNLVIPPQNKAQILREGLIDVIYPMIKTEQHLVVFKLLGTFRMVIDGQESAALDLLSKRDFIQKLVYWCYNSDHLGVRGEVPRLLAWLIKHCHSFKPFKVLVDVPDSVKCIVEMISSNHAVMQNEAFYALNLLFAGCPDSTLSGILVNADIGKNVNFVMLKYSEKMDVHTIENLLTLFEHLIKSRSLVDHLNATHVKGSFMKMYNNPNASNVTTRLDRIARFLTD